MTPTAVDLHALFAPWRAALRDVHFSPTGALHGPQEDPAVWIAWNLPHGDRLQNFPLLLEAIQLFCLLERVDRGAWLRGAPMASPSEAPWTSSHSWREFALETRPIPRVRGWKLQFDTIEQVNLFCMFLSESETAGQTRLSPQYGHARRVLEAMVPSGESKTIAMHLGFYLDMGEWRRGWEVLPSVTALATLQAMSSTATSRLAVLGARLEVVDFLTAFGTRTDALVLARLQELCRLGIVVANLPCFGITTMRQHASNFIKTIMEELGSRSCGIAGKTRSVYFPLTNNLTVLAAIALATTDATRLDHVRARFPGRAVDDHTAKLYWMAYALFSQGANPSMRKVNLNCRDLTEADVQTMEQLLRADDPLTLLYQDHRTAILEHRHMRLSAAKFLLVEPPVESSEGAVLHGTWMNGLRILGFVGEWWVVCLPSWGRAWVHVTDAKWSPATVTEEECARPGVKPVDHLQVESPGDLAATAALLRLVGKSVRRLVIRDLPDLSEYWCTELFDCCPQLEELHIEGMMGNGLAAMTRPTTIQVATKLERLFVSLLHIDEVNLSEFISTVQALSDRHHPLSKQLRTFGFYAGGVVFGHTIVDTEAFTHALRMLDENKTLEIFRLYLPITVTTHERARAIAASFDRHQGLQLALWANHIEVRAKAAFISVLQSTNSSAAMRALDHGVISHILDFAPRPRYRNVNISLPRVG